MKLSKRTSMITLGAIGIAAAATVGAVAVPGETPKATTSDADVVAMLRERSPGVRAAGAETSKFAPVPATATAPAMLPRAQVLGERDAAPVKMAAVAPAVLPAPVAAAPAPVAIPPAAVAPVAVAAPIAALPVAAAAASSGPGLAAVLPFIPAVVAIGGGGGGGGTSDIAPPIPEPGTWLMMITGFGLLGFALRRRRRQERDETRARLRTA